MLAERVVALVDTPCATSRPSRAREGAKLRAMLDACCDGIETQVERVAPRVPAIHAAYVEKLGGRLREAGLDPNEERLKQELALFATKVDVAEEVSRLATHVAEVRRVLAQGGSAGKRLDFLVQELHREANTLGSKSVDAELSQVVARAQGADRADARAGPEHRMTITRSVTSPSSAACSWWPRRRAAARPAWSRALLEREPGIRLSVSYTTRPPRSGEHDGVRLSLRRRRDISRGWRRPASSSNTAHVHGNWYATSATWLKAQVDAGSGRAAGDRLAGRGAGAHAHPTSVHIFILPPSLAIAGASASNTGGRTRPR